ncbi:MAG: ATP-dependent DNA helicase RecG [Syntrophomonadaceae bacterium]
MKILAEGVQFIKGVGPQRGQLLNRLDLDTVFDLMWNFPRTYLDRSKTYQIEALSDGEVVSIRGRITATDSHRTRRGFHLFKAKVEDDSGAVAAIWFNQSFLSRQIKTGQEIFLTGKVKTGYGGMEIFPTEYDVIDREEGDLPVMPVYHLTEGLSQKSMRQIMLNVMEKHLPGYPEILDPDMRERYQLCDIGYALQNLHFPASREAYLAARRRLAFEELLLFKLNLALENEPAVDDRPAVVQIPRCDLVKRVKQRLPFELTAAQERVVGEICADMAAPTTMNRLLQGDVGSGKTVVAALAMAQAVAAGYQAAMMVPTEILAEQHFRSLERIYAGTEMILARLTGGMTAAERRAVHSAAAAGEIDILVGTQALIQDEVVFENLGLAIIDEQHRFGVRQRGKLGDKGLAPDILVMTATPIPRTLALALYGNLNVSVLDQLPPGRLPVKTVYIPRSARDKAFRLIYAEVSKGAQAYVVCPLIEESEKQDLRAAITIHKELQAAFPDLQVGLLHGRLKPGQKEATMQSFKQGYINILVTTTVIEVGVDVPNATLMLVEHAERFGLSQLHQLRGRVGRGPQQSYCVLVGEPATEEARQRLHAMEKTSDGFELANEDLKIRGPGDFWGVKQHGLNELKVANLLRDQQILADAAEAAVSLGDGVKTDGQLAQYINLRFKKSSIAMN